MCTKSCNLGHNILELYSVLVQIRLTSSKMKRDIVAESHCRTTLRLRIQGNKEIFGKSQILGRNNPLFSLPEIKLWQQQSKNTQKQISNFSFLPSFTGFLYFVTNILLRIVSANKALILTPSSPHQTSSFRNFVYHQSIFSVIKENVKQVSYIALPNLMVSCEKCFACLVQVKICHYKAFTITFYYYFDRTNFFKENEFFFQKF